MTALWMLLLERSVFNKMIFLFVPPGWEDKQKYQYQHYLLAGLFFVQAEQPAEEVTPITEWLLLVVVFIVAEVEERSYVKALAWSARAPSHNAH